MRVKSVVVVNREQADTQAIYVDGALQWVASTAYAHEIIEAVGGPSVPFTLDFHSCDKPGPFDYPQRLDSAVGTRDFESGPIPPYYAKVIDVGPEGETNLVEVMPTHVAHQRLGLAPGMGYAPTDYKPFKGRAIIVNHPHGATIIEFNENGASSETISTLWHK